MPSLPNLRGTGARAAITACLFLLVPLWGQKPRAVAHDAAAAQGRRIFAQSCAFCHGADANGGAEAPSLMRSALVRHDRDGDLIAPVLRDGRPDKGMPRLGLNGDQIGALVAFLHAQLHLWDRTSPGHPSANHFSLKLLLTGDARAGEAYFDGAGGCAHCHSATGDLAGIARRYSPADLQARFLYPAGKPKTATVTLPSGKTVSGLLVQMDAFTVALRDQAGWYHSWPLRSVHVTVQDPLAAHKALVETMSNAEMHNLFAYLETLNR